MTDKYAAIIIKEQSLQVNAPSSSSQFLHNISLLNSRTDRQRKDALSYLTSSISNHPTNTPLPEPVHILLPKLLPLTVDANDEVRAQLVKLFHSLPSAEIGHHVGKLLPYIRSGMCHLAAAMRSSSLDVLDWALDAAGRDLVTGPGGWLKMLKTFSVMLAWSSDDPQSVNPTTTTGWTSSSRTHFNRGTGTKDKVFIHALQTLSSFLHIGLVSTFDEGEEEEEGYEANQARRNWPLRDVHRHMMPKRPNAFGYLQLFGPSSAHDREWNQSLEDRADRQTEFHKRFRTAIESGIKALKQEGGEIGRAAAKIEKAVVDGMKDFEDPEEAYKARRKPHFHVLKWYSVIYPPLISYPYLVHQTSKPRRRRPSDVNVKANQRLFTRQG